MIAEFIVADRSAYEQVTEAFRVRDSSVTVSEPPGIVERLRSENLNNGLRAPSPSTHPVDVGQRSEGAILHELISRGYEVLIPWGVNQRYDLLIDQGGRFIRCQCKTGRLRAGAVQFRTNSTRSSMRAVFQRGYLGEADLFLIHCPETGGVYVVPVEDAPSNEMRLRVAPCKNNQSRGIHWAQDFELPA